MSETTAGLVQLGLLIAALAVCYRLMSAERPPPSSTAATHDSSLRTP